MSGNLALVLVIGIRTLVPLSIPRWPLLGGLLSIAADASDAMLFEVSGSGILAERYYHQFDKVFDIYYLTVEAFVVSRWRDPLAKWSGLFLYLWRMLGFAVFEVTSALGDPFRASLLVFPAVFENFYLGWLALTRFRPHFRLTRLRLAVLLLVVGTPKVLQEYLMHYKYPDQTWDFVRDHLFSWLY
jgi:hypothetical protein